MYLTKFPQSSLGPFLNAPDSEDDNFYSIDSGIHCFTSAGSEVEVKDQQIQTEISETAAEHKHVQAGSVTSPPTSMC